MSPELAKWVNQFSSLRGRAFGPLEYGIIETLWMHAPMTVLDIRRHFPRAAYTTLMTTLDRLYKKGLLTRSRQGHRYAYRPAVTRLELQMALARGVLRPAAE